MNGGLALAWPVMAQILLTFTLLVWTGRARVAAIKARRVRLADIALSGERWPDDVKKIANNMHNQFETPVLFYVLCGVATVTGATGVLMTALAWAFVVARLAHTAIHVTSNRVPHRFCAFLAGTAVLMAMWAVLAVRLVAAT